MEYRFLKIEDKDIVGKWERTVGFETEQVTIYRCPEGNGLFGVDSSLLESDAFEGFMISPFNSKIILDFGADEDLDDDAQDDRERQWCAENLH